MVVPLTCSVSGRTEQQSGYGLLVFLMEETVCFSRVGHTYFFLACSCLGQQNVFRPGLPGRPPFTFLLPPGLSLALDACMTPSFLPIFFPSLPLLPLIYFG